MIGLPKGKDPRKGWDGSTPWLVTGYAEQRAVLADPRVSADLGNPELERVPFKYNGLVYGVFEFPVTW